ncbi:hypothetical protein F5Y14DRAFT_118657 [Nemania sp. NC0429]|nr:hypothetical protein F5Y14DRAFT_118657 [Nemania sp. NC0429]
MAPRSPEAWTAPQGDSPPSYEEPAGNQETKQQPGPATSGRAYHSDTREPSIRFKFCPDPSKRDNTQEWMAALLVKCDDVPSLMREGFHWDRTNIIKEEGYFDYDYTNAGCSWTWNGTRHYFLEDLQRPPRWIATIEVFAAKHETLCCFDLGQLSLGNNCRTTAYSQSRKRIYEYIYGKHQQSYNAIYDDMPMEGQWPWPRKSSKDSGEADTGADTGGIQR